MRLLRSHKIRYAIAFGIGAGVGILYLMSVITANAETVAVVSVAANGQTIVKGARVTAVSGSEIIAISQWGAATIQWTIEVSGSTRFLPERDRGVLAQSVRVGETIGFTGILNQKAASPTVRAAMVRNESVIQSATVISGNVISADPTGLIVQTDTGTSTIRVSSGTIMTKDGNSASSADVRAGESINALGTFNAHLRVLDAERVQVVSVEFRRPAAPAKTGLLQSLVAWLSLRRGALSLR